MYTASSDIASGDTLSSSNLTAVPNGGLNKLLAAIADEVSDRIAAFNNLTVDLSTAKETVAQVVSAVSGAATGGVVMLQMTGGLAPTFLGGETSNAAVGFFYKASASSAYFHAFNRDNAASGELSLGNSTVTVFHSYVSSEELAPMFVNDRSVSVDNVSISAGSMITIDTATSAYSSYKPSKAGYTPIAISGFTVANADTGGTNYEKCTVNTMLLYSGGNVYARVRNHSPLG